MVYVKGAFVAVLFMALITVMSVWAGFLDLGMARFFGVRQANVQRQIFEQSQSYNEGMLRDLENLQMQYVQAKPGERDALRLLILHRFEVYPIEKMPPDLRLFYASIRAPEVHQ